MSNLQLKKLVRQLDKIKGRHTELVTVYVPANANLNDIITNLRGEGSTAENIKSKQVRKNVTTALDKIIRYLQLYKKTPVNGLAVFCGNTSEKEGSADMQIWAVEPPEQIKVKMYWCDQRFVLEPLKEMIEEKEIYGIINLDKSEADIAMLIGKKVEIIAHFESIVPGKTRAGGQCLAPDSLVQMGDGTILEISKVSNPHIIKSVNFTDMTLSDRPVIEKWETKKNSKYIITTKCPTTQIECSGDHLFYKWGNNVEEVAAEDLKKGDFLLMPEKIDVNGIVQSMDVHDLHNSYRISEDGRRFIKDRRKKLKLLQKNIAAEATVTQTAISVIELGKRDIKIRFLANLCKILDIEIGPFIRQFCVPVNDIRLPEILDEKLANFLGYFAGDGSFENERISLFDASEQTVKYYGNLANDIFNCNSCVKRRESKGHFVARIYGKPLVKLIRKEFPELKYASNTEMPVKILKSPDSVLAAFLKGFFDAEGYVNKERGIGLGINNKKMAKQVQLALLRFGILSSLVEYDNRRNPYSKKHRFTIGITERKSLELFFSIVGFNAEYKTKLLEGVIKNKSVTSYTRRIFLTGSNVRKILEAGGYKVSDFPKVTNFFRNERLMSKEVFRNSILNEIHDKNLYNKLESSLNYNLVPVKIKSIKNMEEETDFVDIEVKNSNFIANGLVVHNSSARFSRVREGLLQDWYKKIAEASNKIFVEHEKEIIGVIVSGPGPIKEFFLKEELLYEKVAKKILGTVDTSYTGEFGVHETIEKSGDLIKEAGVMKEKKLLMRFFQELQKPHGLAIYGLEKVREFLERGSVDTVILTEDSGLTVEGRDAFEWFEEAVENYGSKLITVSSDTREGDQFRQLCGVGAMLRY